MTIDNDILSDFDQQNIPYNLEAEQSVLGCIIIDKSTIHNVIEIIKPNYFFIEQHKLIFNCMLVMFNNGNPIDFVTLLDFVNNEKIFENENSAKLYLTKLLDIIPSTSNINYYCDIIKQKFYARELILTSKEIINNAYSTTDIDSLIDNAEQRIFDIRQNKTSNGLTKIDSILLDTFDNLQKLYSEDNSKFLGLPSGFSDLDNLITGLNKSDLILIAARPAMGKTSFALNIATNCAIKTAKQVAVFSLEMSKEQLVSRMLASESRVDSYNLKTGNLSEDDWINIAQSSELLYQTNIYIDDTPGISVSEIKSKVRKLNDLGLIIIDYLQLMSSNKKSENRVQEISEITRNLKIMAKQLDVPVISLSQLSRAPDARADHRPMLSDLRESGSIEQDADIVMFLYRDHYYNKEEANENIAECIVAKNRHGESNTIKLSWEGRYTRFGNLELYRHE